MGRWRVAASLLFNPLTRTQFHSPKFLPYSLLPLKPRLKPPFLFPSLNKAARFRFTRPFSAIPCPVPVYSSDSELGSPPQNHDFVSQDIPIKAYFLSTSIDLKGLQAENLGNIVLPSSPSTNYVGLRYYDFPQDVSAFGMKDEVSCFRYIVVFQYGSAVLFNIEDHEVDSYLEIVRRHASGLLPEMRKDDYAVKEQPLLAKDMQGGPDYIVLKTLDTDSIHIIGTVLGQSIALDYYVSQVDGMVEEFAEMNRAMEKTGTFTVDRTKLIKLIGKAHSNLADVILRVGLFERSEIAWREAKYAQIYEHLREEYELTQRFGTLDFKLKFVEHNVQFLQKALHNRQSDLLEWCIIFLLAIGNVIGLYEIICESTGDSI